MCSPVNTRAWYMRLRPLASGVEYWGCAEYRDATAKYTPWPNAVAVKGKIQLRRFALRFINPHSDATGVFRTAFLGNCRVDDFQQPC